MLALGGGSAHLHGQQPEPAERVSSISGQVLTKTEDPVPGADILLDGSSVAKTSEDGKFRVDSLGPGQHTMDVRAIGFGPARVRLALRPHEGTHVVIRLGPVAQPLPDIVATTRRYRLERVGYYERRETERGRFIERDSIMRLDPTNLVWGLSRLQRFRMPPVIDTNNVGLTSLECRTGFELWVNGWQIDSVYREYYLRTLHPDNLEAAEIYEDGLAPQAFTRHELRGCVLALWERD